MGKRKSSPRLATTSRKRMLLFVIMNQIKKEYTLFVKLPYE
ncbi:MULTISPECIES: hypothetical protein [Sutcliffiella]|nr:MULTISPECIES: hypothetical protein [Sutcliffiella]MED4015455.1 hypothetical protein [Sutcliffiella cohnii]WBL13399.1 hypothetical protein O1A01_15900 [Sutcliffiella sp. NC1]